MKIATFESQIRDLGNLKDRLRKATRQRAEAQSKVISRTFFERTLAWSKFHPSAFVFWNFLELEFSGIPAHLQMRHPSYSTSSCFVSLHIG
jgi:hypothetical protein